MEGVDDSQVRRQGKLTDHSANISWNGNKGHLCCFGCLGTFERLLKGFLQLVINLRIENNFLY